MEVWLERPPYQLFESAWVNTEDQRGNETGEREYFVDQLGYGRHGDGWALLVRRRRYVRRYDRTNEEETLEEYEDGTSKPLLRASRELRIAAVKHMPHLIEKLENASKDALERIEQAKKIAESL